MKKLTSITLFVAIFLCIPGSSFAQSPYQCSWQKDSYILGTGIVATTAGLILGRSVSPLTTAEVNQLSRESVNWLDRSATSHYSETASTTSDILVGFSAAAPFALFANQTMCNDWRTITLMYLETWLYSEGSGLITKGSIGRIRPFVYNPNVPLDTKLTNDARQSFFSEHTSVAFASAVFLSTVYSDYNPESEWKPYVWAGSLLTASAVGYLRYEAGMHFPTDIFIGAIVGSAIGYVIPWMHRAGNENVSITPGVPGADYGFSVQVKF